MPTTPAWAARPTSPRRRACRCCAPGSTRARRSRRSAYGETRRIGAGRGRVLSRRPRSRKRPDPHRPSRRDAGRIRGLQAGPRSHLRAVRARALRHVHHRVHVRPADLPVGTAGADAAVDPRLVGRQPGARDARACCSRMRSARRSASRRAWPNCAQPLPGPLYVHGAVDRINGAYRRGRGGPAARRCPSPTRRPAPTGRRR